MPVPMDERAFIARVEAAEPEQFATLLSRPSRDEERALRAYFTDERFERLHTLAVRRAGARRWRLRVAPASDVSSSGSP